MRVELTDEEWFRKLNDPWLPRDLTLAWRAFGKVIGIEVHDPILPIDGDSSQFEPITKQYFHFKKAEGKRYLSLGHYGVWDGGAMRSLSPHCIYISYTVPPYGHFVEFHGWHRPEEPSRIIPKAPDGSIPFMTKDQLSPMVSLIAKTKLRIAQAG